MLPAAVRKNLRRADLMLLSFQHDDVVHRVIGRWRQFQQAAIVGFDDFELVTVSEHTCALDPLAQFRKGKYRLLPIEDMHVDGAVPSDGNAPGARCNGTAARSVDALAVFPQPRADGLETLDGFGRKLSVRQGADIEQEIRIVTCIANEQLNQLSRALEVPVALGVTPRVVNRIASLLRKIRNWLMNVPFLGCMSRPLLFPRLEVFARERLNVAVVADQCRRLEAMDEPVSLLQAPVGIYLSHMPSNQIPAIGRSSSTTRSTGRP